MVNSNGGQLLKLDTEIVELEKQIPDREMRYRLLATPKRLFAEAHEHHRKGNGHEARLTINCACTLLERAKDELKKHVAGSPGQNPATVSGARGLLN